MGTHTTDTVCLFLTWFSVSTVKTQYTTGILVQRPKIHTPLAEEEGSTTNHWTEAVLAIHAGQQHWPWIRNSRPQQKGGGGVSRE